ncbi:MAG: S24 family peptidase [Burkholderiaceae bacterium]|nr:S24 family peptidase [Burkholderiaceae bacterium]
MDMHTVRRHNLRALIEKTTHGSVAAFGRLYDFDESRLSQLLSDTYRSGNNFGEKAARTLEQKIGLPMLALDAIDARALRHASSIGSGTSGGIGTHAAQQSVAIYAMPLERRPSRDECYEIAIYDVAASMGDGLSMPEHADVVERMTVSASWLKSHVKFSHPDKLALITAYGDSMEGTFSDGDMLLVDRGVTDIKIDAVYVLALNDELYIKRLQRRPDGAVLMISDNKRYAPYVIENGEREKFQVLGRVLLAWNANKL